MPTRDRFDNPLSPCSDTALHCYELALADLLGWRGDPLAAIEPVLQDEPAFMMGQLLKAWALGLSTEPSAWRELGALLPGLGARVRIQREQDHLRALSAFLSGCPQAAGRQLDALCAAWPRDALALQAGHFAAFLLGDSSALRARVEQALPVWREDDPGFHALLAMLAFGAEETGDDQAALSFGRQALQLEPADGWAHHAVAHVLLMRGEHQQGLAWMASRQAQWRASSALAVHNRWHWALFHLALGQPEQALAVYDEFPLAGDASLVVDLIDATALLARLQLHGVEIGDRWRPLAQAWSEISEPGAYLFNDFHAQLAWVADGRIEAAEANLARYRALADAPDDPRRALAGDLGVPLLRGLLLLGRGQLETAIADIRRARVHLQRMGGSFAQRKLVELLLSSALVRASRIPAAEKFSTAGEPNRTAPAH